MIDALSSDALRQRFDPSAFDFDTTEDLPAETEVVGQDRAVEALDFGMNIDAEGYNVFALGPTGTGRRELVQHLLEDQADAEETPPDLCYVNNFEDEREPTALQLPAGRGCELKEDVDALIEDLQTALPGTFESEEYQSRREMIQEEVREGQERALEDLQERAREDNIALIRTPQGFVFTPIRDGEVVPPEEVDSMPDEEREAVQEKIQGYQDPSETARWCRRRRWTRCPTRNARQSRKRSRTTRTNCKTFCRRCPSTNARHAGESRN